MRSGEAIRPEIERAIVQKRKDYPAWSQQRIADEIHAQLGVALHRSTISKVLKRHGIGWSRLRYPSIHQTGDSQEDAAQAELSGHWPRLRTLASALAAAVALPLPQLLGFPWSHSLARNAWIAVYPSGVEVRADGDDTTLMRALREHLPQHDIWGRLAAWERTGGQLAERLRELGSLVDGSDALRDWLEISKQEADEGTRGRTEWFAKSIVLVAAERAVGIGRTDDEYRIRMLPHGSAGLVWERVTNSFVPLGSAPVSEDLAELQALHERMAEQLDCESIQSVHESLQTSGAELREMFGNISHQAQFAGICSLWSGT